MVRIGKTDLDVHPLNLGGNVFGWTADEDASYAVLDAYVGSGGNFVDTADSYSAWAPGNRGGESEEVLGRWLRRRGRRDDVVLATKVSQHPQRRGLAGPNVMAAAEDSLRRLGVDHIDLYYAHFDDETTPLEETLAAFDALVRSGKVRYVAGSNYTAARVQEALSVQDREGYARWVALQPPYSLLERGIERNGVQDVAVREGIALLPYQALASGFLTGKYRDGVDEQASPRAAGASKYLDERGHAVLDAMDAVAEAHSVPVAAVAVAWVLAQPGVVSAIASARDAQQLAPLMTGAHLELTAADVSGLSEAAGFPSDSS
jgi:aryl-alcohol dehydrogenase (NADP+)